MTVPAAASRGYTRPALYGGDRTDADGPVRGPLAAFGRTLRERSLRAALYGAYCYAACRPPLRSLFGGPRQFALGGRTFDYLPQPFTTERRAEIPVALDFLRPGRPGERLLEVGNSLARHGPPARTVVDKFERSPGVLNLDILEFHPDRPFDRIVSVSTLEHVGFDEPERDPEKFDRAVQHLLRSCLATDGSLLATFPVGYNPAVDGFIERGHDGVGDLRCMERVSASNDWRELSVEAALSTPVRRPYPGSARVAFWRVERRGP